MSPILFPGSVKNGQKSSPLFDQQTPQENYAKGLNSTSSTAPASDSDSLSRRSKA